MSNEKTNKHLYFNDDGEEISREEFRRNQEQEQQQQQQEQVEWWAVKTPKINFRFTLRHPRLLLQFLRFVDEYNEYAEPDEVFMLRPMPYAQFMSVINHDFVKNPLPGSEEDAYELHDRLGNHLDLSNLESV
jgi:hypothetical protein